MFTIHVLFLKSDLSIYFHKDIIIILSLFPTIPSRPVPYCYPLRAVRTVPYGSMAIPQRGQRLPGAVPQVIRVGLSQLVLALVHVQEEDGQVQQDDDDKGQDEDDGQRCEHPQQVLQEAEVVLKIPPSHPVLQGHEETREDTR